MTGTQDPAPRAEHDLEKSSIEKKENYDLEKVVTNIDLNQNVTARIVNPLTGITRDQLAANVRSFCAEKGLAEHEELFVKGAILAQSPLDFENLDVLSEAEKDVIRHEHAHKWSHPFTLYATIFLCSVGAATQGWDQTGSNAANLSFPIEFDIGDAEETPPGPNADRDSWLVGLVNSAPYIGCAFCGCWLSDPANNLFGRRGVIFISAVILVITPICSGLTHSWQQIFVVRLLLGIGMGIKGSTVPIFAAENSPAPIRGALVMGWQLWTAFGIFLGYAANLVVADVGKIAWRLQLGSAFIPALPLALFIFMCPESPRWLMKKNRYQAAFKSYLRLRHTELQAARDMYYVHVQLVEESHIVRATNYFVRFAELFTIPRVRRATLAASVVMLAQQMCGINIIAFYSSTVFARAGYTAKQALYASLGFGAVNFLFAFPALITIDTFGRRQLLLFTFPQMFWTLLAAGLCFLLDESLGTKRLGLIAFFIFLFGAFYSPGEGPVPFTYSAEVFPLSHREQGMAWAVTVCLGFAAVLSITWPAMERAMTSTGAFSFYAGLNLVAWVLIFNFIPETKQRTLEELDQVFSVPTAVFVRYQWGTYLPWFIKRYIFWQKNAKLTPLYSFEGEIED